MTWGEFCSLLSGLMHDTPLGHMVSIRSEKDQNVIKGYTNEQRKIRNDWIIKRNKKLRENPKAYAQYVSGLQAYFKTAFGEKEGGA